MRRRQFIAGLGSAATWPLAAQAQQPTMPVIGYLGSMAEADVNRLHAFRQGLGEAGFAEGRNVTIEYRAAPGAARVPELAAALIRRQVSVIVGSALAAARVQPLTNTVPIVFWSIVDPVQVGLVTSLNRPGANLTGVITMGTDIVGKQLSLMRELLPSAKRYALLVSGGLYVEPLEKEMRSLVEGVGGQTEVLNAGTIGEIDNAFASRPQKGTEALFVAPSPFLTNRRVQIATLATRYAIPTIHGNRDFVEVGGLMSYGASETDVHRQMGAYVGRVLKGEKPADLPVLRPTKFELVINLTTARAIGLTVPPTMLAIADEVIE
jgi:putative tryptophan/tyrosine transport system substrate-binding protein